MFEAVYKESSLSDDRSRFEIQRAKKQTVVTYFVENLDL